MKLEKNSVNLSKILRQLSSVTLKQTQGGFMKFLVFFILFLFSIKAVSQERELELYPDDGSIWLSEEDVIRDALVNREVKPEKKISCEKKGIERLYFIFKPGILDNTNLCEMYFFSKEDIEPKKYAD